MQLWQHLGQILEVAKLNVYQVCNCDCLSLWTTKSSWCAMQYFFLTGPFRTQDWAGFKRPKAVDAELRILASALVYYSSDRNSTLVLYLLLLFHTYILHLIVAYLLVINTTYLWPSYGNYGIQLIWDSSALTNENESRIYLSRAQNL